MKYQLAILMLSLQYATVVYTGLAISYYTNWEQKLVDDIFQYYDPQVPPFTPSKTSNMSRTVVRVQVIVYGIKQVDLMDSTVTLKCAFRHWWNDTRTSWNKTEYGGIDIIWMKTDPNLDRRGWIPDLMVRQDAGDGYFSNMKFTDIKITANGENYWSTIGDVKVIVSFDVVKFPYDIQNITITYGSWIYPDNRIALELYPTSPLVVYDPIGQWVIDNIEWEFYNSTIISIKQVAVSGTYMRFSYVIFIKRQGGTMLVAILIPGCLITFLGVLYYFLPTGGGERTAYLSTILLTEIMFLVMLTGLVPQSREIPTMAWFFLSYTIMLAILTIIVLIINKVYSTLKDYEKKYLEKIKQQLRFETQQSFAGINSPRNPGRSDVFFGDSLTIEPPAKKMSNPILKHFSTKSVPSMKTIAPSPSIEVVDLVGDINDSIDVETNKDRLNTQTSQLFLSKFKDIANKKIKNDTQKFKVEKYTQERNQMKKKTRKIILRIDLTVFLCALIAYSVNTIYMIYKIFN